MSQTPRNRKIMIAAVAALASLAIVVPLIAVLLTPGILFNRQDPMAALTTTTTTPPPLTIKPLQLRSVNEMYVIRPGDCDPKPPVPPDQPLRICDLAKTALFDLGPEVLTLQLTDVDSFLNPLTAKQIVQVSMTPESTKAFAEYTGSHIDQQVAFVRSGVVVWAPKITEKIDGDTLQLSGEVTEEQAREMARMLKDEA
ncbi:protein export protein SecD, putative [Mycolicibacterium rhodesiae JS60]|nr:protein export protein SecD, putative [Mycolicibacterium rhodesiae JS60]